MKEPWQDNLNPITMFRICNKRRNKKTQEKWNAKRKAMRKTAKL
jgi:hypothetical protein